MASFESQQSLLHQLEATLQRTFSVGNCYVVLQSNTNRVIWPWKKIWFNSSPLNVSCLTRINTQKRGFQLCSRCPLCEERSEEVGHLFFVLLGHKSIMEHVFGDICHVLDHA